MDQAESSPSSKLLMLPAELRHQIYLHLYSDAWLTFETHPAPNTICKTPDYTFWVLQPAVSQVLLTCKQGYNEASDRVYTIVDRIRFKGMDGIMLFNRYSTIPRRNQIRYLEGVCLSAEYQFGDSLGAFANLETVHITCIKKYHTGTEDDLANDDYDMDLMRLNMRGLTYSVPEISTTGKSNSAGHHSRLTHTVASSRVPDIQTGTPLSCANLICLLGLCLRTGLGKYLLEITPLSLADRIHKDYQDDPDNPDQFILQQRYAKFLDYEPLGNQSPAPKGSVSATHSR